MLMSLYVLHEHDINERKQSVKYGLHGAIASSIISILFLNLCCYLRSPLKVYSRLTDQIKPL